MTTIASVFAATFERNGEQQEAGRNTQFPLADLFRQSAYSRLAGYEDLNDATRLARHSTFRLVGSKKVWERRVPLTFTLHWFETDLLAHEENLTGFVRLNRELLAQAEGVGSSQPVMLDMDSTESPVYGEQEQSAYNGYFESVCYHPLFLFNGDCLAAKLRPGNVHSAERREEVLLLEIERQQQNGKEVAFRGDAAFAKPEIYQALEERGVKYAIRLPANENLERNIRRTTHASGRTAEPKAGGALQGFSEPGSQLIDGTSGSGEGRVSRGGSS